MCIFDTDTVRFFCDIDSESYDFCMTYLTMISPDITNINQGLTIMYHDMAIVCCLRV